MKNRKILFTVLFVLLFILINCSRCFASTEYSVGVGEDNNCGYSVEKFNSLVKQAQEDERVTSGKYYYFVSFNYGDRCINSILIDKSVCDLNYGYIINEANWGQNGFYHHVLNISTTDLKYENTVTLSGRNALKRDNSDIIGLSICRNKDGVFYFSSNYDHNIYTDKDCTKVLFHPAPQEIVARQVEMVEMSQVQAEILGILPLILVLVVSFLGLRKALKMLQTFLHRS